MAALAAPVVVTKVEDLLGSDIEDEFEIKDEFDLEDEINVSAKFCARKAAAKAIEEVKEAESVVVAPSYT